MKASEMVDRLNALISEYGDLEVVCHLDHEFPVSIHYVDRSWIADDRQAFEISEWDDADE